MGSSFRPKETYYHGCEFRSRIEARWAVVFDTLGIDWVYEPQHYELGVKYHWDEEDEEELQESLSEVWDEEDRAEIKREAWWKKHEQYMYLPDFYLPDFECWVEIKGKPPTREEEIKARRLAAQTRRPVHILWGTIPDPHGKLWGECTQVFPGRTGLMVLFYLEFGMKAMEWAFTVARQARFSD